MATKTVSKPFTGLRCVHCGEVDCLDVKVETLAIECRECSEEITRDEVEVMIATFRRLFAWIDSATTFAAPK